MTETRITGIGNTLVDILINETDAFLDLFGKEKGGMTLVGPEVHQQILAKTDQIPAVVPGGAACNTIVGIGRLGGEAAQRQRARRRHAGRVDRQVRLALLRWKVIRQKEGGRSGVQICSPDEHIG